MLDLLIQTFAVLKQIGYFGLVLSFKTGQTLINGIYVALGLLLQLNKNLQILVQVLFEDFYIFHNDVTQRVAYTFSGLFHILQSILNCLVLVIETVKWALLMIIFIVTETYNIVFGTIGKLFSGLMQLVAGIKYFFILLGSGIWFSITIVPLFVVYTFTMCTYYTGCLLEELINIGVTTISQCKLFSSNAYSFITDVPFESIAGLTAGVCIVYVVLKFHIVLCRTILSTFELARQSIRGIGARFSREHEDSSSDTEKSDSSDTVDEDEANNREYFEISRMCVICQERNKCILMLPCRHICVCQPCNTRLRNYNRTCPMCRSVVQDTMKVFV